MCRHVVKKMDKLGPESSIWNEVVLMHQCSGHPNLVAIKGWFRYCKAVLTCF